MRKFVWTVLLLASFSVGTAYAIDVSGVLYQADVDIINLGITRTNDRSAHPISGGNLIADGFVEADFLNGVINQGVNLIPAMPPNNLILDEGAVLDDGGSFTEFTTEIRDTTELDVALLPLVPAVDDAFYVGCDNPCRILSFDIGQEGIGGWEIDWTYWNGTEFFDATNVIDQTNDFRLAGERSVSFDMPTDMATSTITGSSVNAFWVRGAVTSVTGSASQQAIGNIGHYENGQYWMWFETLAINEQVKYQMSLGGADIVDHHQIFPGTAGIVTLDDATMEPSDDFSLLIRGSIDFDAIGLDQCIVCKDGALIIYPSAVGEVTATITGAAASSSITVTGITATTANAGTTPGHEIRLVSDTTNLTLSVGSAVGVTATQTVTGNAANWEWATNGALTYVDEVLLLADITGSTMTYNTLGQWDGGTLTGVTSFAGPRQDISQNTIAPRQWVGHVFGDTGEWNENGSVFDETATSIGVGFPDPDLFNSFFRFTDVNLPQGASIDTAQIRVKSVIDGGANTTRVRITALDADNAAAPTTFDQAETPGVGRTTAFVDWSHIGGSDAFYQTPDITSVIQEIIDRPGWVSGNAIVVYLEDNGSDSTAEFRNIDAIGNAANEDDVKKPVLWVELDEDISTGFEDDFIQIESTRSLADHDDWVVTHDMSANIDDDRVDQDATSVTDTASNHGAHVLEVVGGVGDTFDMTQNIATTPGTAWSIGIDHWGTTGGTNVLEINWLDSDLALISTDSVAFTNAAFWWNRAVLENQVAPANTAFMQYTIDLDGSVNTNLDGAIACVAATAPIFPNSCNVLVDGSFEATHSPPTITWESGAISVFNTVNNVGDSWIFWQASENIPGDEDTTTMVVEVSIGDALNYAVATNGGSLPGVSVGDDLSLQDIFVRITFTNVNKIYTPFTHYLQVGAIDAMDSSLHYKLNTTPGVTIEDRSINTNDGTMSYPVQGVGLFSTNSPLESTRINLTQTAAVGVPDFAAPVTGSATDNNLFGDDPATFLPLGQLFSDTATDAGLPVRFIWIIFIMILGIMAGAFALKIFKSTLMASVILGLVLLIAAWIGDGIIPGWAVVIGFVLLVALNLLRPRLPI